MIGPGCFAITFGTVEIQQVIIGVGVRLLVQASEQVVRWVVVPFAYTMKEGAQVKAFPV